MNVSCVTVQMLFIYYTASFYVSTMKINQSDINFKKLSLKLYISAGNKPGLFLVRESNFAYGDFVLSFVHGSSKCGHYPVELKSDSCYALDKGLETIHGMFLNQSLHVHALVIMVRQSILHCKYPSNALTIVLLNCFTTLKIFHNVPIFGSMMIFVRYELRQIKDQNIFTCTKSCDSIIIAYKCR